MANHIFQRVWLGVNQSAARFRDRTAEFAGCFDPLLDYRFGIGNRRLMVVPSAAQPSSSGTSAMKPDRQNSSKE